MTFGSISKIFALAALSIFPYRHATAQSVSKIADLPGSALISGIPQHTGCHLPAAGRVRGLVLFIQTANDDLGDADWKLNEMPSWAGRFKARLRDYFGDMSNGGLQLELDVHPSLIVTQATEHSYLNAGKRLGQANRDILQSLDAALDYAPYDNWRSVGNAYNVQPEPDNEIELIITLYRRVTFSSFFGFSGVSDLGFEGYLFVDGGARRIYGGSGEYNDARASGITVVRTPGSGIVMDEDWAVNVSIHELMHKFFGEGHPTDLYGGLGVLSHGAGGVAMSSFERHTLGYINYRVIPHGIDSTITLSDYVTTGDAAVLSLPEAPNWHYAFEYRRRLSQYDTAPADGIFIYRIYTPTGSSQKQLQVISAAGAHQWELDSVTGKPFRLHPDPIGGYNEYQKIPIDGKTY